MIDMATLAHPPLKTWTRAEIEALEAAGLLAGFRCELIEGDVFDKMGQKPLHASAVTRTQRLLEKVFGAGFVRVQAPVEPSASDAPYSLPEPDVVVTREMDLAYRSRHPHAGDVLLLIEVADTSVAFDTKKKARLYARAGFAEYVVLDLADLELLVHREPRDGTYRLIEILRPGDVFIPAAAADARISVEELLIG